MRVLVVNAGSSSLKLSLLDSDDSELWGSELEAPRALVHADAVEAALAEVPAAPDAVGHRIVHGGDRFREPVIIDSQVEAALEELAVLAPLHQPKSLAAVDAVGHALPDVPAVGCFDTAFHATLPPAAATYALPREWRERYGLRRYGFHGLSHAYAARAAGDARRVVTCHLGAGASLCAVLGGRSVDTTMGFTPLEGLVMATRSGSVDPGLILWLQQHEGLSVDDMADALEHEAGLLGLAGTADMRELLSRDDDAARLAVDVYVHRLRAGIGAMAAALDGLDALVFTGGVGENSSRVRELACTGLSHLGIGPPEHRVDVLVVRAREDLEIARQVRALLGAQRLEHL
ncbi:MAG TPA: acetate/propionate family kinase [Thermoleophilaceae bacterium]|nr:acetate/propionate family kinase [Thermoleophilaceae bacterium]